MSNKSDPEPKHWSSSPYRTSIICRALGRSIFLGRPILSPLSLNIGRPVPTRSCQYIGRPVPVGRPVSVMSSVIRCASDVRRFCVVLGSNSHLLRHTINISLLSRERVDHSLQASSRTHLHPLSHTPTPNSLRDLRAFERSCPPK